MAVDSSPTRLEPKLLNSTCRVALASLDSAEGESNLRRSANKCRSTWCYTSEMFNLYRCLM